MIFSFLLAAGCLLLVADSCAPGPAQPTTTTTSSPDSNVMTTPEIPSPTDSTPEPTTINSMTQGPPVNSKCRMCADMVPNNFPTEGWNFMGSEDEITCNMASITCNDPLVGTTVKITPAGEEVEPITVDNMASFICSSEDGETWQYKETSSTLINVDAVVCQM